ncbi:unnamed protein product [Trichogramma brassicae]|uniref:Uncharacterized protein n=1 Tax=Trichogramma brassicae TaxID=86971 RepID=A0A6H5J176_9HYME|nr:unnamed protein product [Trichogramma brassicae]
MATTSTVPSSWYSGANSDQQQQQQQPQQQQPTTRKNSGSNSAGSSRRGSASTSASGCTASTSTTTTCPPPVSSFPDKFQDFFAALKEDCDDLPTMLEDKLIPRDRIERMIIPRRTRVRTFFDYYPAVTRTTD